jgi:hypothetical protein
MSAKISLFHPIVPMESCDIAGKSIDFYDINFLIFKIRINIILPVILNYNKDQINKCI